MVDTSGSSDCSYSTTSSKGSTGWRNRCNYARKVKAKRKSSVDNDRDDVDDDQEDHDVFLEDDDDKDEDDVTFDMTLIGDYSEESMTASAAAAVMNSANVMVAVSTSATSLSPSSPPPSLGVYDVICGRHKAAFNNIGNRRFRCTIALALPRFLQSKSRKDKSIVIESIRQLVHQNGGKFLIAQSTNATPMDEASTNDSTNIIWEELDPKQSHLKVGHALRDAERKQTKALKQQQQQQQQHNRPKRRSTVMQPSSQSEHPTYAAIVHSKDTKRHVNCLDQQSVLTDVEACTAASCSTISYTGDTGGIEKSDITAAISQRQQKPPPEYRTIPAIDVQPTVPTITTTSNMDNIPTVTEHHRQPLILPLPPLHLPALQYSRRRRRPPPFTALSPVYNSQYSPPPIQQFPYASDTTTATIAMPLIDQRNPCVGTFEMNNNRRFRHHLFDHSAGTSRRQQQQQRHRLQQHQQQNQQQRHPQQQHLAPTDPIRQTLWRGEGHLPSSNFSDEYRYDDPVDHHHHQHMMQWLMDESDDVIDDGMNSLGG
jgi:hypothetical protein